MLREYSTFVSHVFRGMYIINHKTELIASDGTIIGIIFNKMHFM